MDISPLEGLGIGVGGVQFGGNSTRVLELGWDGVSCSAGAGAGAGAGANANAGARPDDEALTGYHHGKQGNECQ